MAVACNYYWSHVYIYIRILYINVYKYIYMHYTRMERRHENSISNCISSRLSTTTKRFSSNVIRYIRLGYTLVEIFIYERKFETIVTPLRSILYTYRQHRCIHVIIV